MAHGAHPGWFAMVMATGIVSAVLLQAGFPGLSVALGWLAAVWPAVAAWALVFAGMAIVPFSPARAPRRYPWRSRRRAVR